MLRSIVVLLVCAGAAAPAAAQTGQPPAWTASVTVSGAESDADVSTRSGVLAIERRFAGYSLGATIGASGGDLLVPDILAVSDTSSVQGSIYWTGRLGVVDASLSLGYGAQTLDASVVGPATGAVALRGRPITVEGDVDAFNVSASLSRTFGETWLVTPSLLVSYDTVETTGSATTRTGTRTVVQVSEDSSGVTVGAGLNLTRPLSAAVSLYGGGAYYSAEDAAATTFSTRRAGGFQPTAQTEAGSAQWGEVYAGASFGLTAMTRLDASIGTTLGQDAEEIFGAIGLAWSF